MVGTDDTLSDESVEENRLEQVLQQMEGNPENAETAQLLRQWINGMSDTLRILKQEKKTNERLEEKIKDLAEQIERLTEENEMLKSLNAMDRG
ncbi:hypothetical protein N7539_009139 [Penicillium diatomitis]|uniref:Uncharacterized protein n=1 Tax=Penicillium diatomitis TaxID=2819901 RepID=A0A9X0BJE9_9EURO|nr:uncharacterized protein N7539_009139 [Penicillium diatomitis]KAJ5469521.1 hypothetical protein N7539_009139 [Penicillium diatomitis]